MNYDFAQHCYLLAKEQFNEGCRQSFYNPVYSERCFKRSDNLYDLAALLGYTHEVHSWLEAYNEGA